jgi:hypothetical protein
MTAMKLKDKIQHQLNIGFSVNDIYSSLKEEGFETSEIDNAINEISVERIRSGKARIRKIGIAVVFVIAVIIFIKIDDHFNKERDKNLRRNAKITLGYFTGEIITRKDMSKDGPWYLCKYEVNNVSYSAYKSCNACKQLGQDLFKKKHVIIYDSTDPGSSRILIFPKDFSEFNLNQDSIIESIRYLNANF